MTDRPTDEVTGKVVAKQHGIDTPPHTRIMVKNGMILVDPPGGLMREWKDPRDDTDAALELLGYLQGSLPTSAKHPHGWDHAIISSKEIELYRSWPDDGPDLMHTLPLSGEPFCYAVVRLAARVWGVEE